MSDADVVIENPVVDPVSERRDATVPMAVLAFIVSIVAVGIALVSAQSDSGSKASSVTAATLTDIAAKGTDKLLPASLPLATKGSFDVTATRYDPETAPVAAGPKTFNLTMQEHRVKVDDKVVALWTFNDTAPGPVLRAVVGDRITVNLTNEMSSKMLHSIDYHASRLSMGGGEVQVAPGKTGTFSFTAEYPGVFMYHCATPPVLEHIGRGMYGMLIVQPKTGFGPKMREVAVVQSELYRDFTDMQSGHESAVVMNGIPKQYVKDPIRARPGERVRMFFLNAGPSKMSSFHIVGTVFDTVLADGNPRNITYGRQAIAVPTSGSAVVDFQLIGEGTFPFLTHSFHDVNSGAVGLFVTGDGSASKTIKPADTTAPMSH